MSNKNKVSRPSSERTDADESDRFLSQVYVACVFTDLTGGKETRVFATLDDAKSWCEELRSQIIQSRALETLWNTTSKGVHYLTGSLVGAAQIVQHSVRPDSKCTLGAYVFAHRPE